MRDATKLTRDWARRVACAIAVLVPVAIVRADDQPGAVATSPGIRQISSEHLTLFTDLPASSEVDALAELFDQALPQWCAYFGVDPAAGRSWQVRGYLMKSRERFEAAGLVPAELPAITTGYARGNEFWLYDQTSPYYRRHLLLHEGTHVFMSSLAQGSGPPWFSEGLAELMATHRLEDGKLTLKYFPRVRDEVPKWGRIEIVQNGFAARRAMSLSKVFAYGNRAHLETEPYGWCWAAAAFFDGQTRYQSRFRQLPKLAGEHDFPERVLRAFAEDWPRANEDWQLYVANLDYGYDFERMNVEYAQGTPLADLTRRVTIAADRGWQSSGVALEAGKTYRLRASGRYQVAREPRPWECEPGGVTIRYYRSLPLGILLAAVRADDAGPNEASGLLRPSVVGLETTLSVARPGTLYLRINDSAGSLADNAGSLTVEIASPGAAAN